MSIAPLTLTHIEGPGQCNDGRIQVTEAPSVPSTRTEFDLRNVDPEPMVKVAVSEGQVDGFIPSCLRRGHPYSTF